MAERRKTNALDEFEKRLNRMRESALLVCDQLQGHLAEIRACVSAELLMLTNDVLQNIEGIRECANALDRVMFDDYEPEDKQGPEWWKPFLNLSVKDDYTLWDLCVVSKYQPAQVRRRLEKYGLVPVRREKNYLYTGDSVQRIARQILSITQVKKPEDAVIRRSILKLNPEQTYSISDISVLTGVSYRRILSRFGDLKAVRDSKGAIGFRGQDLLDAVAPYDEVTA